MMDFRDKLKLMLDDYIGSKLKDIVTTIRRESMPSIKIDQIHTLIAFGEKEEGEPYVIYMNVMMEEPPFSVDYMTKQVKTINHMQENAEQDDVIVAYGLITNARFKTMNALTNAVSKTVDGIALTFIEIDGDKFINHDYLAEVEIDGDEIKLITFESISEFIARQEPSYKDPGDAVFKSQLATNLEIAVRNTRNHGKIDLLNNFTKN